LLLAVLLLGCAEKPTPLFMVGVRVESDPGVGLAGASLSMHGRQLGVTDATGLTVPTLAGVSGETIGRDGGAEARHQRAADADAARSRAAW
jgi:hypothetical protein